MKKKFEELKLEYVEGRAITGLKAKFGKGPVNIAVIGELDAVICASHPMAVGNAAHACGHDAQLAGMLGVGFGLVDSRLIKSLDGTVTLFAVPAEEGIEYDFRRKLVEEGKLEFMSGKQELIKLGDFDDVSMAMMCHSEGTIAGKRIWPRSSSNASLSKMVRYIGKPAHYTAAPWNGVNALNAALLGIQAVNALRETFRDEDFVRFTPIITKGGESENAVPSDVYVNAYVKARTMKAVVDANRKVNRALISGSYAIGTQIEISEFCNFMPIIHSEPLAQTFSNNASQFMDVKEELYKTAGSTDMGDVSMIMPAIHPFVGGSVGGVHRNTFKHVNEETAFIIPAKVMAMTIVDLLYDNARLGKKIALEKKSKMSKEEYLKKLRGLKRTIKK
ncbi:MAG: M20/M25/M40 family metallo-hydrolase [Nitrososphaeria archaeon]